MLLKKDLLSHLEEQYHPMFKNVSIPDFTKCVAEFSGLHISQVADSAIEEYLTLWAKNKYRFFIMLGNKTRYDKEIDYEEKIVEDNQNQKFKELETEFPAYALWLKSFRKVEDNKIIKRQLSYDIETAIEELFPNRNIDGISLTHFFKNYLSAPDDLVTKVGRLFENKEITATYTISIDPVDMMLASENPYNWTSCYRISTGGDGGCHGDGPIAAMIDDSSLITYIWNKEGDFSLYGDYTFKNVRYKRMRKYVSISPSMNSIHFNDTYPGRSYPDTFEKMLRECVEDIIDKDTIWKHNSQESNIDLDDCDRKYLYGYNEFSYHSIYFKKLTDRETWYVYNEKVVCPCGCGRYLIGSDNDDDVCYNDEGFTVENEYQQHYCEIVDEYCENYTCDEDCMDCPFWARENAICELDESRYCEGDIYEAENTYDNFDPYRSNIVHCDKEFCKECPFYEKHCKDKEEDAEMAVQDGLTMSENSQSIGVYSTANLNLEAVAAEEV